MRTINLKRPIVFFDLETTGTDINKSRIVQAAFIKILSSGEYVKKKFLINPGCPIPPEATAVHKITDEIVKDQPKFSHFAIEIYEFINDSDIGGFNSNLFDVPLIIEEFVRCNIIFSILGKSFIDVRNMYVQLKPRTLGAAYQDYTGKTLQDAHDADVDIEGTIEVFMAMINQNEELPTSIEELAIFSNYGKPIIDLSGFFGLSDDGVIIFTKGKHKDKAASSEKSYLEWLIREATFANNTKQIARSILKGELY